MEILTGGLILAVSRLAGPALPCNADTGAGV